MRGREGMGFLFQVTASGEVRIGSSNRAEAASLYEGRVFASTTKRVFGAWGIKLLEIFQILLYGPISIPRFLLFPDDNSFSYMKSGEADNSIDFVIWQLVDNILSTVFSLAV